MWAKSSLPLNGFAIKIGLEKDVKLSGTTQISHWLCPRKKGSNLEKNGNKIEGECCKERAEKKQETWMQLAHENKWEVEVSKFSDLNLTKWLEFTKLKR